MRTGTFQRLWMVNVHIFNWLWLMNVVKSFLCLHRLNMFVYYIILKSTISGCRCCIAEVCSSVQDDWVCQVGAGWWRSTPPQPQLIPDSGTQAQSSILRPNTTTNPHLTPPPPLPCSNTRWRGFYGNHYHLFNTTTIPHSLEHKMGGLFCPPLPI